MLTQSTPEEEVSETAAQFTAEQRALIIRAATLLSKLQSVELFTIAKVQRELRLGYNTAKLIHEEVLNRAMQEKRAEGAPVDMCVELAVTGGLGVGAKLRESRLFKVTAIGVEFAGDMSYEQWCDGLKVVKMAKSSAQVWLADFLGHGRKHFGQERVEEALVQLEFPLSDVNQALGISELAMGVRHPWLTSEHYWVLAKSELTPGQQEHWAAAAVKHGLSAFTLKRSIAEGRIVTDAGGAGGASRSGGVPTIQGFRQLFDTWFHQVDTQDPIAKWTKDRKRELWEELKGPVQIGLQIARELGIEVEKGVGE